jgi:hypothetical protein
VGTKANHLECYGARAHLIEGVVHDAGRGAGKRHEHERCHRGNQTWWRFGGSKDQPTDWPVWKALGETSCQPGGPGGTDAVEVTVAVGRVVVPEEANEEEGAEEGNARIAEIAETLDSPEEERAVASRPPRPPPVLEALNQPRVLPNPEPRRKDLATGNTFISHSFFNENCQ